MIDLANVFASLERYVVARSRSGYDLEQNGITWIWAANGIWKQGKDAHKTLCIRHGGAQAVPGLDLLLPVCRWHDHPGRIPGHLLTRIHRHACTVADTSSLVARPIEQQYLVMHQPSGELGVRLPVQTATPGSVRYEMPDGPVLVDIHSHHQMEAYFSHTDDNDDQGLSVSCVIGKIFSKPQILCRLNVYGDHRNVPALTIFEHLGPFQDAYQGTVDAKHA